MFAKGLNNRSYFCEALFSLRNALYLFQLRKDYETQANFFGWKKKHWESDSSCELLATFTWFVSLSFSQRDRHFWSMLRWIHNCYTSLFQYATSLRLCMCVRCVRESKFTSCMFKWWWAFCKDVPDISVGKVPAVMYIMPTKIDKTRKKNLWM